jgi:hypothetical protein
LLSSGQEKQPFATPSCENPARLQGEPAEEASYIVVFHYDRERPPSKVEALVADLAEDYGFEPDHVYAATPQGFAAVLTDEVLAGVRCAPAVDYVDRDATGGTQ